MRTKNGHAVPEPEGAVPPRGRRAGKAPTGGQPFRRAHGGAAKNGRLVVSEVVPVDELAPATGPDTDRSDRSPDGRFQPGNKVAKAKRLKAGSTGHLAALERQGDPAARAALAFGRRWAAHRRVELAQLHGGEISSGVGALVESAGDLLAHSRYWSAQSRLDGNIDAARLATQSVAGFRQCERDAWHIAALEADARRRAATTAAKPWYLTDGAAEEKPAEPTSEPEPPNTLVVTTNGEGS